MKIKKQINIDRFLPGVQKNISLKNYITFKIGGKAKYFFAAKTKKDLILAITVAKKLKIPFFILGGGSNLLVSDQGYKGLVIKIENCKLKTELPTKFWWRANVKKRTKSSSPIENCKVGAESGVPLGKLVNISIEKSLTGLEWAAGIPGTVGGAVYGNCGAFQKSMKDIIEKVEVFDTEELRIMNYELSDCQFGYRDSIFKRNKNLIILSAKTQLKKGKKKEIQKKIKEYLNYKKEKQPLNYPSAGSIFKNPPRFSAGELVKEDKSSSSRLAAARLIEKCGLKGKRIGSAKISEKHANFIVNLGGGKAKNVMRLINLAKKKVKKKFKINLEEEIQHLPERSEGWR